MCFLVSFALSHAPWLKYYLKFNPLRQSSSISIIFLLKFSVNNLICGANKEWNYQRKNLQFGIVHNIGMLACDLGIEYIIWP